jgi:hypothetical protein
MQHTVNSLYICHLHKAIPLIILKRTHLSEGA